MLEIKNISKVYQTGDFTQKALDNVSIKFRKQEFVSILGPSGSGKTTLLNIVSGLDRYDKGDLIINNKSTKVFKDADWDAYRNNCIGFIFQNYNLISHISILNNVEMGLTLSGVSKKQRRRKALEALKKVGLEKHINKKPSQLSGGQMQRVAIARALANDPDVILADEPTGALDTKTSIQIMELINEIAQDKLVIMVTHNSEIAKRYSNRIIELSDGKVINDSNPISDEEDEQIYNIKKTAMSFPTALSLSFNNIKTKKGRTILTAFAASIGIIGIALILALSNGFDGQISKFEATTLSSFPITISKQAITMDETKMKELRAEMNNISEGNTIVPYNSSELNIMHINKINEDFINYLEKIDSSLVSGIAYSRMLGLNIIDENRPIVSSKLQMQSLPKTLNDSLTDYLTNNYDLLAGEFPKDQTELLLLVDEQNRIETEILATLGFATDQKFAYHEIIAKELTLVMNDDYYKKSDNIYVLSQDFATMSQSKKSLTLKIVGIVKPAENTDSEISSSMSMSNSAKGGILYTNELMDYILENNLNSKIVKAQKTATINVLSGEVIANDEERETLILYLGGKETPAGISIYPSSFDAKEAIIAYLDAYNENKADADQIVYMDLAKMMVNISGGIMSAITYVLIAFSAVSLVVSGIMIGIITYISVIERTKEIGVLRSLGARKKDISRVFNAETFIIGFTSGILGIGITYLLIYPINVVLENLTELSGIASLNPIHALGMIALSILITLVGGFIPAKMASKKEPVEALRSE